MDPAPASTQPTLTTRIKVWWDSVCLFTKGTLIACIVIFVFQSLFDTPSTDSICYSYLRISREYQVWRLFTAPLFHASFLHIVFNMFALVSLGIMLERKIGTTNMLVSTMAIAMCAGLLQFGTTLLATTVVPKPTGSAESSFLTRVLTGMVYECGVGLSAVLFAYLVVALHYDPPTQNMFGFALCPAYLYPWILLFVSSLLMVGVSFFGHLSGILAGYVLVFLLMKRIVWVRMISWIESKIPTRIVQFNSFVLSSQQQQQQQQASSTSSTLPDQNYVFSTSRAEGRTLGRAPPPSSSPSLDRGSIVEEGGLTTSMGTSLSNWFRGVRESASSGYQRLTSLFAFRSGARREYDHLDEEEEELPAPMSYNVDPRFVISNTRTTDQEEQEQQHTAEQATAPPASTESQPQSNAAQQPTQQPPPAPPSTQQLQQQTPSVELNKYFDSLEGSGRRLGGK